MRKSRRYIIVGTNKDGHTGSWDDLDSDTWRAPYAIYDTHLEMLGTARFRWKWQARLLAWLEN